MQNDTIPGKYVWAQKKSLITLYVSRYIGNKIVLDLPLNTGTQSIAMVPGNYLLYAYSDTTPYSPVVSEKDIISRSLKILGMYEKSMLAGMIKEHRLMKLNS